ncbi:MAG: hypothetical protein ACFFDN_01980 [Candidatus Hodarchaeota archaeon]
MDKKEYDKTRFYCGIKAKVNNMWYLILKTDFETRDTLCQTPEGNKTFPIESIQEFSKLTND